MYFRDRGGRDGPLLKFGTLNTHVKKHIFGFDHFT